MFRPKSTPLLTYLGQKTELSGSLLAKGMVRVDGMVYGSVEVEGDLEISATGVVEGAEVKAQNLIVQGTLKADKISVVDKISLGPTARIEGDVVAGSIQIESGAYYTGYIQTHDAQAALPSAAPVPELYGSPNP
ncbi:MAG: polymer-forming cytoskeletal protein [Cyanobacteria bacterium REEB459]|nr:polymer-forming cytoskeletal protein [Cyanobacteria bacterium REEB459]